MTYSPTGTFDRKGIDLNRTAAQILPTESRAFSGVAAASPPQDRQCASAPLGTAKQISVAGHVADFSCITVAIVFEFSGNSGSYPIKNKKNFHSAMGNTMIKKLKSAVTALALSVAAFGLTAPDVSAQDVSTWEAIKDRGSLRVGVTQAPPWFYKDPLGDEWTGLGSALGKAMADTLGVEFEPVEVTWATAIAALQADKIDIQFVLDATPTRAMAVDFPSEPLLFYALAVLADDDMEISTWEDLNKEGIKVSVSKGTTMEAYITKNLPNAEILSFPGNGEALAAFQSGRVNAVCLFHPPLIAMRKNVGRGQIVIPTPFRSSASSAAVRREADKTFRDWVGTAISYYYNTGETQKLYEDFLVSFGVDPSTVPPIRQEDW